MPPAASGPVFTVSNPIFTGLFCAIAGAGTSAAAAAPARKVRRETLTAMGVLLLECRCPSARDLERRGILVHRSANGDVADPVPERVDFGEHDVVRLLDVDGIRDGHPARPARQPEHFRAIAFGIQEVAADRARVVHDALDAVALGAQPAVKGAEIVEALAAHRDLLDEVGVLGAGPPAHQRDLVVDGVGIRAEEHDAQAPVLLGDPHAHDVAIERDHRLEVTNVDPDVAETGDSWHGALLCRPDRARPGRGYSQKRLAAPSLPVLP